MINAPETRNVCALTGNVADRPSKFFDALAAAPVVTETARLRTELDATMQQLKDATSVAASLATSQAMWHAHFDEQRDRADEYAERCDAYLATIDELQAEVAELREARRWLDQMVTTLAAERDTANAKASL